MAIKILLTVVLLFLLWKSLRALIKHPTPMIVVMVAAEIAVLIAFPLGLVPGYGYEPYSVVILSAIGLGLLYIKILHNAEEAKKAVTDIIRQLAIERAKKN